MKGIFISYRREDTSGHALHLYEVLRRRFWKPRMFRGMRIFMDIDSIKPGEDFTQAIEDTCAQSGVFLVLIGRSWSTVTDESGRRRIENADDFVRMEIARGLANGVAVIPILLDGAHMPTQESLPADLQGLALRQAFELSNNRFDRDINVLITAIRGAKRRVQSGRPVLVAETPVASDLTDLLGTSSRPPSWRRVCVFAMAQIVGNIPHILVNRARHVIGGTTSEILYAVALATSTIAIFQGRGRCIARSIFAAGFYSLICFCIDVGVVLSAARVRPELAWEVLQSNLSGIPVTWIQCFIYLACLNLALRRIQPSAIGRSFWNQRVLWLGVLAGKSSVMILLAPLSLALGGVAWISLRIPLVLSISAALLQVAMFAIGLRLDTYLKENRLA